MYGFFGNPVRTYVEPRLLAELTFPPYKLLGSCAIFSTPAMADLKDQDLEVINLVDSDADSGSESEEDSSFRLNAKHILVTYAQCGDHVHEELICHVECVCKEKGWSIKSWAAATELHSDGKRHVHIGLKFSARPNIKDPRVFDYPCDCGRVHRAKCYWMDAWRYLCMLCAFE